VTVAALETEAVELMDRAVEQLDRALHAYRSHDLALARSVVIASRRRHAQARGVYESGLALLGDGSPPVSELRRIAALLHVVSSIQRIGGEIATIAQLARAPGEGIDRMRVAGELTLSRLTTAREAYAGHSSELAAELMGAASEIGPARPATPAPRGPAIAVARCLERIEDDAAEIGEQVIFVSSGLFAELADNPWPGELAARSAVSAA
jgi:phosphate transport system protein